MLFDCMWPLEIETTETKILAITVVSTIFIVGMPIFMECCLSMEFNVQWRAIFTNIYCTDKIFGHKFKCPWNWNLILTKWLVNWCLRISIKPLCIDNKETTTLTTITDNKENNTYSDGKWCHHSPCNDSHGM